MGRSTNKGIKGPQSVRMTILHFLNEKRNINKIPVIKLYKNLTAVNLFKNLHKFIIIGIYSYLYQSMLSIQKYILQETNNFIHNI